MSDRRILSDEFLATIKKACNGDGRRSALTDDLCLDLVHSVSVARQYAQELRERAEKAEQERDALRSLHVIAHCDDCTQGMILRQELDEARAALREAIDVVESMMEYGADHSAECDRWRRALGESDG